MVSSPFRVLKHFTLPGVDVLTTEIKTLKDIGIIEADKNIYNSNFKRGESFTLNQLDSEVYLTFIDNVSIYDSFDDKKIRKNKGKVFELVQGKVILIKQTSFGGF